MTAEQVAEVLADESARHDARWGTQYDGKGGIAHEEHGGLRCSCGWDSGPTNGLRPWTDWHRHVGAALAAALPDPEPTCGADPSCDHQRCDDSTHPGPHHWHDEDGWHECPGPIDWTGYTNPPLPDPEQAVREALDEVERRLDDLARVTKAEADRYRVLYDTGNYIGAAQRIVCEVRAARIARGDRQVSAEQIAEVLADWREQGRSVMFNRDGDDLSPEGRVHKWLAARLAAALDGA